jgi:UDP-N-acetylenolpyruvoylglucosamine reductase
VRQETLENFSFSVTMAAGDANKTLLAARAGKRICVTHLVYHVLTTAAQSCDVAAGTTVVKRIAVSEAVGSEGFLGPMIFGLPGQVGSALVATPSAAGYAIHFAGEGYYD